MKNLIIKNKILIILTIALILVISGSILSNKLTNLDEIWNYNFSRNIADGKIPYKDFNIVQLPGLFLITSIFLKISNELIITRILGCTLSVAIMIAVYKLLENLKVNKYISAIIIGILTYIFLIYFNLDYNFFNLFLILILMILEYKNFEKNDKKINIIIGFIAGLTFLVKQTTGAFVILATILIKLLQIKKENVKPIFKVIITRILGILIPIILFVIYLTINGAWKDFIDYAILGMFTFSNKISYLGLIKNNAWYIKALGILVPIYLLGITIYALVKRDKTLILFLYGLASLVVVYPISDNIHFLIGALPAIIGIIYFIYCAIEDILEEYKGKYKENELIKTALYYIKCGFYIAAIVIIIIFGNNLIKTTSELNKYTELKHFSYIPVKESLLNTIKEVDNYMLNKEKPIYILDASAAVYMVPLDRYNKDYDMFLKGNIGKNGEEGQIEKIKSMDEVYFLVMSKKQNRNWQTPDKVLEFVENNLTKIDTIAIFDVYYKEQY